MEDRFYTIRGFKGLTAISKLICLAVFIAIAAIIWKTTAQPDIAKAAQAGEDTLSNWISGLGKMLIAGFVCAFTAQFFLPRTKIEQKIFYCADCGHQLGTKIVQCQNPACLSNRYTTAPQQAKKAKLKIEKEKQ